MRLEIARALGETRCKGSPLGRPGDPIDIGVLGGRGIGCLGALGDRGTAPGKAPIPRGDIGGEFTVEEWLDRFRGMGEFIGLSTGRGLMGNLGLIRGGETTPEASLSIPAKDPALGS